MRCCTKDPRTDPPDLRDVRDRDSHGCRQHGPYPYRGVSAPNPDPNKIMRRIKGRTSTKLLVTFPELKMRYRGRHFWARGYIKSIIILRPRQTTISERSHPKRVYSTGIRTFGS
ncbi:hypothetical protein THIOKS13330010 [Thiocapsa sp. KS1]|nr:hypothetical protein THIOKS13330010 [Thiocapsa sp. KS1]